MQLRGPYAEDSEPALELCMKIQRRSGVNGVKAGCASTGEASIRVVPPSFRSLQGTKARHFLCGP